MFHESTESLGPVVSASCVAADLSPCGQVEEHRKQASAICRREDNHGYQMSYNASTHKELTTSSFLCDTSHCG